jgi:hypothetical protein
VIEYLWVFGHVGFLCADFTLEQSCPRIGYQLKGIHCKSLKLTLAQQISQAAGEFQEQRTGHKAKQNTACGYARRGHERRINEISD